MLKELSAKFYEKIKKFLKHEDIIDIILFGSSVRGKEFFEDIDILVIYSKKNDELEYKVRKELEKADKRVKTVSKIYTEIFSPEFSAREAILSEGFSLKNKKFIAEGLGYQPLRLFRYYLKGLNQSRRMQFYYSLHGRGSQKGLLEKAHAYKFSEGIILAEVENSEIIKEFFEKLKMQYEEFPVIIPKRIFKFKISKKQNEY